MRLTSAEANRTADHTFRATITRRPAPLHVIAGDHAEVARTYWTTRDEAIAWAGQMPGIPAAHVPHHNAAVCECYGDVELEGTSIAV